MVCHNRARSACVRSIVVGEATSVEFTCSTGNFVNTLSSRIDKLTSLASALTRLNKNELGIASWTRFVSISDDLEVALTLCADSSLWGALKAVSSAGLACIVQVVELLRALDK